MAMDPVTCPMCQGGIPGKEIHILNNCPGCGADLSALVQKRLAMLRPPPAPPPPTPFFLAQAVWFSLFAPCFSVAVHLLGSRAFNGSPAGMRLLETVCTAIIAGGFIFGVIALYAPKGEKTGKGKAIAGLFINGLLISFLILSIVTRQKVAASENNTPDPPRKGSIFISGN